MRRLEPWHANVGKRLVKSPRIYVRDSGITHALLGLTWQEDVLGHPVAGASWEGFVIETLIATAPPGSQANFYRTTAGAEIDLLLTFPGRRIVVYPGMEAFPLKNGVEVLPLTVIGNDILQQR